MKSRKEIVELIKEAAKNKNTQECLKYFTSYLQSFDIKKNISFRLIDKKTEIIFISQINNNIQIDISVIFFYTIFNGDRGKIARVATYTYIISLLNKDIKNIPCELGDYALFNNTVAMCSNLSTTVLVPDNRFFTTKKYKVKINNFDLSDPVFLVPYWCGKLYKINSQRFDLIEYLEKNLINFNFICHSSQLADKINSICSDNMKKKIITAKLDFNFILKYLVQINVDGISNSFNDFFLKLASGRPLLKIKSLKGFQQWCYSRLKPDYHYFDVSSDLSNFKQKYYQALEEYKINKVFPGREFILEMNFENEMYMAAEKIYNYFK
jgi:hypothetical protein